VGWGVFSLIFALAGLEPNPPDLCLHSSWDYRSALPQLAQTPGFLYAVATQPFISVG
jgi:hypothetical protein